MNNRPITDPSSANLQANLNNISAQNLNSLPTQPNEKETSSDDSNILVAIRVRPLIHKELSVGDLDIVRNEGNLLIVLDRDEVEHEQENKKITDILHRSKEQRYAFDKIFREHTQEQIYNETCKNLIKPVLDGYNACVFAYGPTGTGKTYTMIGTSEVPGLNVLTIRDIFDSIKRTPEREFTVQISYVEIYNETIRDLLVPSSSYLELRDDPIKGIQIAGVTELKVENSEQLMNLIIVGNRRRTTEATNANQTSSRSHAVFQITVTSCPRTKNIEVERTQGKLSLIDLAGSERGTVTENRGIRLREGAKINRSLLALANCINALGDKSKKGFFVPYRDSKLTRLLKDSLGGNSKTVMIANISPAGSQIEETLNTLKYASRAKNIKTKMVSNKKLVSMHIAEYKNIINDLRQEIEQLKSKMTEGVTYNQTPTQLEPSVMSNQSQCPCVCGRMEDEIEMKKIQTELFENFQERIQLRRALMELEEQNALNHLEIKRKQAEIVVWRKKELLESQTNFFKKDGNATNGAEGDVPVDEGARPLSAVPNEIKQEFKNIQTLRMSTDKNTFKREMMNMQLAENIKMAKQIRDSIPKRVKHTDKRDFLEIVIKNHVLELQNIELEIHLQIQEKTVNDLKNIIFSQRKIIEENKLDANVKIPWENEEGLSEGMSQNESDDMNVDDIVYDDENDQDAAEEDDEVDFEAMEYKDMLERNRSVQDGNISTSSNPKQGGQARNSKRGRNNTSLQDSQVESNRSRAESKNKKMLLDFEENKENKILENNFMGDEKKGNDNRNVLAENQQQITDSSPRVGANLKKAVGNAQSANKNDISVVNSVSFPSKDISLALQQHQQQQKLGKKTQSTNSTPGPQGNFLPPLNPQVVGTNAGSTKNVQSNNIPMAKPPQISNTSNSKEPNRDVGKQIKSNIVAMGIYGKQPTMKKK